MNRELGKPASVPSATDTTMSKSEPYVGVIASGNGRKKNRSYLFLDTYFTLVDVTVERLAVEPVARLAIRSGE